MGLRKRFTSLIVLSVVLSIAPAALANAATPGPINTNWLRTAAITSTATSISWTQFPTNFDWIPAAKPKHHHKHPPKHPGPVSVPEPDILVLMGITTLMGTLMRKKLA